MLTPNYDFTNWAEEKRKATFELLFNITNLNMEQADLLNDIDDVADMFKGMSTSDQRKLSKTIIMRQNCYSVLALLYDEAVTAEFDKRGFSTYWMYIDDIGKSNPIAHIMITRFLAQNVVGLDWLLDTTRTADISEYCKTKDWYGAIVAEFNKVTGL